MAITLIHQADYLLFRQLERLEQDFLNDGGFAEKMSRMRKNNRGFWPQRLTQNRQGAK